MIYRSLLFVIFLACVQKGFSISPLDSLRTEKIKGKKYIVHRVEPKETLYAITKRYQVSIEELQKLNPSLKEGLKMYEEIKVPIARKKRSLKSSKKETKAARYHVVDAGETLFALSRKYNLSVDSLRALNQLDNANLSIGDTLWLSPSAGETVPPQTEPIQKEESRYHIVKASETLFGISRMYQVEMEDIQRWNQLSDFKLSIGQKLLISNDVPEKTPKVSTPDTKSVTVDTSLQKKPVSPPLDTLYVETDNSQFKTKTKEVEGKTQTVEEGFAMKIEDTDYTSKFLALHRTAPLGSTVKVKNQMTNQTIEARVVGKLPESAMNQKLLMRLSSAAYKALGAIDLKTPVTVSYLEDE